VLTIEIEDEVWGFNDYYRVYLHYVVPGRIIYISGGIPRRVTRDYIRKANIIAAEAVRRLALDSLNVTSFKGLFVKEGFKSAIKRSFNHFFQ
jgi:hypothetical protein